MKQRLVIFVSVVVLVFVAVLMSQFDGGNFFTAGNGGWNLKQMNNDTTISSVVGFAEINQTSDQNLEQITTIMNWEKQYKNGLFFGADLIGCASTEFNLVCPTYDVKFGADFQNGCRVELKTGNFTRNSIKTSGFDPQFMNFCTLAGDPASVSNAVQLSLIAKNTKVMIGHQGGDKFFKFNDGNYYTSVEQKIKNFSVSGGLNFEENKTTGYVAAKLNCGHSSFTTTCNKLGSDNENYVFSYNYNGINLGKGFAMNVGSALYLQSAKSGLHMVTGLCKGSYKLFAEAGGYKIGQTVKPLVGFGLSYKL
jgi:hypothetical protein